MEAGADVNTFVGLVLALVFALRLVVLGPVLRETRPYPDDWTFDFILADCAPALALGVALAAASWTWVVPWAGNRTPETITVRGMVSRMIVPAYAHERCDTDLRLLHPNDAG